MARLSIYLLGPPRIERDGEAVEVDTRKATALLAYLVISGQTHQREALSTFLWPEADELHGRAALRRTLSALNKALNGPFLDASRDQIGLQSDSDIWLDVNEFHLAAAGCSQHSGHLQEHCHHCLQSLFRAVELVRGEFMEGFSLRDSTLFDDWQFYQGEALRREFADVLQKLSLAQSEQGQFEQAIISAHRWLALDPLLEEAHRQLIRLYAWNGQRNAALRQYRECVRILEQELGVAPLEETTHLYQLVLEKGSLPLPVGRATPQYQDFQQGSPGRSNIPAKPKPALHFPLVGRSVESSALLRAYQASQKDGRLCILQGENGIGKTRLAQDFIASAEANGAVCLSARCYAGEDELAYGALIDGLRTALNPDAISRLASVTPHWLVEASRLLPELAEMFPDLPQPPAMDNPGAQSRFFEGVTQVLVALCKGPKTGIFFLDDVQWADHATLDWLAYLSRRLTGRPFFVLLTWRPENSSTHAQLEYLAIQSQKKGDLIRLKRLEVGQIADLVRQLSDRKLELPENLAKRLYQEAEGLPLFVVEYLNALIESQQFGGDWPIPLNVRQALHTRLVSVNEPERQVLSAAAAIGRSFDFELLREASARSLSEVVTAIEAFLARGLIIEEGSLDSTELRYDFSHNKLREVVYQETSLARRRLLHQRIAEALVNQARPQNARKEKAGLIATHFQLAGQESLAADYLYLAGDYAASVYANAEAIELYLRALALAHPLPGEIHKRLGDLYILQGDYVAAVQSLQTAAALASSDDLPALEAKLADVHHRRGDWKLAEAHLQTALEMLDKDKAPDHCAILYAAWSDIAFHQGQVKRAQSLAREALRLAEASAEPHAVARAHNMLGILARERSDFETAICHLQSSLQVAIELEDDSSRIAALNNLALLHGDVNDYAQAIVFCHQALELCSHLDDRHRAAALHNNLADLYHVSGDDLQSMQHLKEAARIFSEIRVGDEELQPTVWKLVEW